MGGASGLKLTPIGREDQVQRGKFQHALDSRHGQTAESNLWWLTNTQTNTMKLTRCLFGKSTSIPKCCSYLTYLDPDIYHHIHRERRVWRRGRGHKRHLRLLQRFHRIKVTYILLRNIQSYTHTAAWSITSVVILNILMDALVHTHSCSFCPPAWWEWSRGLSPGSPADMGWWPFPLAVSAELPTHTV